MTEDKKKYTSLEHAIRIAMQEQNYSGQIQELLGPAVKTAQKVGKSFVDDLGKVAPKKEISVPKPKVEPAPAPKTEVKPSSKNLPSVAPKPNTSVSPTNNVGYRNTVKQSKTAKEPESIDWGSAASTAAQVGLGIAAKGALPLAALDVLLSPTEMGNGDLKPDSKPFVPVTPPMHPKSKPEAKPAEVKPVVPPMHPKSTPAEPKAAVVPAMHPKSETKTKDATKTATAPAPMKYKPAAGNAAPEKNKENKKSLGGSGQKVNVTPRDYFDTPVAVNVKTNKAKSRIRTEEAKLANIIREAVNDKKNKKKVKNSGKNPYVEINPDLKQPDQNTDGDSQL